MTWWWPWVLCSVGAIGVWGTGRYRPWGWVVMVFSEVLWITYAIVTDQLGFIPWCLLWIVLYLRGWRFSLKANARQTTHRT